MTDEIKRATGLLVIEVVNSNPNGDPDRESDPRQRENGHGEISPVSFKRKLRELLEDHDAPFFEALPETYRKNSERYQILEHRGRSRETILKEMGASGDGKKSGRIRTPSATEYYEVAAQARPMMMLAETCIIGLFVTSGG
ncbi:MAG: type I CRISPR-associated protein Cas7 [Olsenella sp.]|jgi:CRISPR-associated protein Csd2